MAGMKITDAMIEAGVEAMRYISIWDSYTSKQSADATRREMVRAALTAALAVEQEAVATVVWYDPRTDMLLYERPHKIIDASVAFIEAAPIGTKLYAIPVAAPVQEAQVTDAMVEKFCSLFFSDWEDWRTTDEIKEKRFHRVRNNLSAALRSLQSGETSK